jgi:hypothetical protein
VKLSDFDSARTCIANWQRPLKSVLCVDASEIERGVWDNEPLVLSLFNDLIASEAIACEDNRAQEEK